MIWLLAAALLGSSPDTRLEPPAEIAGAWDVESARPDARDFLHRSVDPDSPDLVGRTLIVDREKILFDKGAGSDVRCSPGRWSTKRLSWGFLFSNGIGGVNIKNAKPKDFDLTLPTNRVIRAYALCPTTDGSAKQFSWEDWVAPSGPDQLVFHYDSQTILVLRRRPMDAKPSAAFDCAKASNPTEKVICGSYDLASWDRSVDLGYRHVLERLREVQADQGDTVALKKQQEEWRRHRSACAADAACIDRENRQRVEELIGMWRRSSFAPPKLDTPDSGETPATAKGS